jgi:hypothetical protein
MDTILTNVSYENILFLNKMDSSYYALKWQFKKDIVGANLLYHIYKPKNLGIRSSLSINIFHLSLQVMELEPGLLF